MSVCVDQTFDASVSSNSFPSRESFNHRKFFCRVVRKVMYLFSYSALQKLNLGKCPGSHAVTHIHLKLLKNVIPIYVRRLSILLTSMDVIRKDYGLVMKFQKMNQEGHSLKIASSGKDQTYEQILDMK